MTNLRGKRLGATLATVGLVGVLAACGSSAGTASTSSNSTGDGSCPAGTLNAEGSSAQKNAIEEAIASFGESCLDADISYNPTGSGAGIKQFTAGQVDFAGSDSALNPDKGEVDAAQQRCGAPAWNLPMVAGPIAIAYNLPGVDSLVVTPQVAAQIFSGKVTTWDDPAIAEINPGVTLPSDKITVFFRSDESGTTENFTKYLQAAAPQTWTAEPAKKWTGTGEGREKSSGVADGVKQTAGSVTYVEWSYAKDNKLGVAKVDNGAGPVELTGRSAGEAVSVAKVAGEGNDLRLKLDYATKAPGTYPIVLVTYEIVCSKGLDAEKTALEKAFLSHFASTDVQKGLEEIGYAPLPADVTAKVETAIAAIS
ncbi:MAG TPA: phosphate ABC transporter substrate-binding protein PstS [Actinomycetales bacterium]|nr:phosphate ABC transporter substrate-binding protein PstS [Actinomycetales bacterium]